MENAIIQDLAMQSVETLRRPTIQLTLTRRWNQETLEPLCRYSLPEGQPESRVSNAYFDRPPLTDYDVRVHAWLTDRMRLLGHERHGLWAKLRRLLFDNPLIQRFS